MAKPWSVVARHNDRILVRPVTIGGRPDQSDAFLGIGDVQTPTLRKALLVDDLDLRARNLATAMDVLLETDNTDHSEEEWSFLTDALLRAEAMPTTELDILRVLVTKPTLLVRCLFRLESAPRQLLWRLEEEFPFSWLLIQRKIWWAEAKRAFERIRSQLGHLENGDELARNHVVAILDEGSSRLPALSTVSGDIELRLQGASLGEQHMSATRMIHATRAIRDEKKAELIRRYVSTNDWPKGYGRHEWNEELGLVMKNLWLEPAELRERQPIFDTPVAAAWCCFIPTPTPRTTFLVKRIREHDAEWFDAAYSAAWFQFALKHDLSTV